jgi:hypothetical protein
MASSVVPAAAPAHEDEIVAETPLQQLVTSLMCYVTGDSRKWWFSSWEDGDVFCLGTFKADYLFYWGSSMKAGNSETLLYVAGLPEFQSELTEMIGTVNEAVCTLRYERDTHLDRKDDYIRNDLQIFFTLYRAV